MIESWWWAARSGPSWICRMLFSLWRFENTTNKNKRNTNTGNWVFFLFHLCIVKDWVLLDSPKNRMRELWKGLFKHLFNHYHISDRDYKESYSHCLKKKNSLAAAGGENNIKKPTVREENNCLLLKKDLIFWTVLVNHQLKLSYSME